MTACLELVLPSHLNTIFSLYGNFFQCAGANVRNVHVLAHSSVYLKAIQVVSVSKRSYAARSHFVNSETPVDSGNIAVFDTP